MQVTRALVPGTFDPITMGHVDVIARAASLFKQVIVAVALNPDKGSGTLFSLDERRSFAEEAVAQFGNVEVVTFDTLLVDFAHEVDARVIVRGLRAVSDFEREFQMAQLNHGLDEEIETLFMMAVPKYAYLSSSAVKEIAAHGGSVRGMVPPGVEAALAERLAPRN
ncbi:MAG: pantetheine-phosphate adenylyltransferase [Coriobacteriia bacterium]